MMRLALIAISTVSLAAVGCIDGEVPIGTDRAELVAPEPDSEPDAESAPPSAICEAYCAAAGEVGCPREGDCLEICASLKRQSPGCQPELDALLACATPLPEPDRCGVDYGGPDDWNPPCTDLGYDYETCSWRDPDSFDPEHNGACDDAGLGMNLENGNGYESDPVDCDIGIPLVAEVRCEEGLCECKLNDQVVHTCTNLIQHAVFASVYRGCCADFYSDYFTRWGFD